MKTTFLTSIPNNYSAKANLTLSMVLSLCLILSQSYNIYSNGLNHIWLPVTTIVFACFYVIYAYLIYSEGSSFAPRIEIDTELILIKSSFFSKAKTINWKDIKLLSFGSYQMFLELPQEVIDFKYNTPPSVSVAIKKTMKKHALEHTIEVEE